MRVNVIVACCELNNAISYEGQIPWKISEEQKIFRVLTLHNVVIMGRKTWETLPKRPLDSRINIVLTRRGSQYLEEIPDSRYPDYICKNLDEALRISKNYRKSDTYIIGGEKVYKEVLEKNLADVVYVSKIKKNYKGDKFFPDINSNKEYKKQSNFTSFMEFNLYTYVRI